MMYVSIPHGHRQRCGEGGKVVASRGPGGCSPEMGEKPRDPGAWRCGPGADREAQPEGCHASPTTSCPHPTASILGSGNSRDPGVCARRGCVRLRPAEPEDPWPFPSQEGLGLGLQVLGRPQAEGRGGPPPACLPFSLPQGSRVLEASLSNPEGEEPVEYKSFQWFGATVRAHGSSILVRGQQAGRWWPGEGAVGPVEHAPGGAWSAERVSAGLNLRPPPPGPPQACAPLYSWRTEKEPLSDPVGTCYLSTDNFTRVLEYAPCRSGRAGVGPRPVGLLSESLNQLLFVSCLLSGSGRPCLTVLSPSFPNLSPFLLDPSPSAWGLLPTTLSPTDFSWAAGQGYCQGGFSAEFTKVRG